MITPSDIKEQAERWYKEFLIAEVAGKDFFPRDIRFGHVRPSETLEGFQKIREWVEDLRACSKEKAGYGYLIEFVERKDQRIGKQQFPNRIYFDNKDDYLLFIGREKEFQSFKSAVAKVVGAIPRLYDWILINPLRIIEHLKGWDDLIKVCKYFIANPSPNLYIRELPIEVHTKFIEENKAILRQLLNFLIEDHINKGENEFEKRFNLKCNEPLIRIRILDKDIAKKYFSEYFRCLADLSIPQGEFALLNIDCKRIFILENKTNFSNIFNFLSLPVLKDSIAVFGKGFQLALLKNASWFYEKQIIYWGDIDIHGFQMLSQLRSYFPQTRSLMMDFETFNEFRNFCVNGTETNIHELPNLTVEERSFFKFLVGLKERNRLEQEKISHAYVVRKIKDLPELL
jgi:hypothetical protein